jgi:hypothetical protein
MSDRAGASPARRVAICAIACLVCLNATRAPAQSSHPSEYQLKAVFLFNFAQFVEWPASAFPTPDAPLIIGVLGEDPFGHFLDEMVRGESVNSHRLVVQRFRHVEDITACHILYVSRPEEEHLDQVLRGLKGRTVLTVGDADNFARRGGMIVFVTDNKRIRLRINLAAAEAADLKLSSKLLRPAEIVSTGED